MISTGCSQREGSTESINIMYVLRAKIKCNFVLEFLSCRTGLIVIHGKLKVF